MKLTWVNKQYVKVALHVLVWLIIFSLPYLLSSHYGENRRPGDEHSNFAILNTLTGLFWVAAFYINAHVLVPKLIYPKKYLLYALTLAGMFAFILTCHFILFSDLIHSRQFRTPDSILFNLPTFFLTVGISTAYKFLYDRAKMDKIAHEKQEQNLKTEVSFLRSQISPHFIFNILNNMVALVRLKSDQLEPTIMKLSSLMQYMLYETDEEKVPLKNEVEYLQNYIDLQLQRFGSKVKINIALNLTEDTHMIEPMLLIPFVENAFKHGIGLIIQPQIDIELLQQGNALHFSVCNKYNSAKDEIKDKTSGIGLGNVTRRLNLLYPNAHSLLVTKEDNFFNVSLQLTLH